MTDYKLMPVEPTEQMLQAGQDAWLKDPLSHIITLYKAMLAAAPDHIPNTGKNVSREQIRKIFMRNGFTIKDGRDDLADYVYAAAHDLLQAVQGEPVAEVCIENDYWNRGHFYEGYRKELKVVSSIQDLPVGTKLYTAPQPAEQPECGCCGQTVQCDPDCDAVIFRKAEQQPVACVGCEGSPAPENSPCAVCGLKSTPDVSVLVEALRSILGWRELRSGNDFPVEQIEEIARDALVAHHKRSEP